MWPLSRITLQFYLIIFFYLSHFSFAASSQHANTFTQKQISLNLSIPRTPNSLDPSQALSSSEKRLALDLFEGLMIQSSTGTPIPGIADTYSVSTDQKSYTFHLRKNAKFSDGSSITPEDVIYTFQRLLSPKTLSPYSFLLESMLNAKQILKQKKILSSLGISKIDPETVLISLEKPIPDFLNMITMSPFSIVKKSSNPFEKQNRIDSIVFSGAYQLFTWESNSKIELCKNPYYWDQTHTKIEKLNYLIVPDSNLEIQMYQENQIDLTFDVPSSKIQKLKQNFPDELKNLALIATYYLDFNLQKEPFRNNLKLRKALSMAINREFITDEVLVRGELPAYTIIPNEVTGYLQKAYEWADWPTDKRISEARKLYNEAGYSIENPLKISLLYNTDMTNKKILMTVVNMWQKTFGLDGLHISLENKDLKSFLRNRHQGYFEVARQGVLPNYNHLWFFSNIFKNNAVENTSGYYSAEFEKQLELYLHETDPRKKSYLLSSALHNVSDDYPVIPLFYYASAHLIKPYVKGYTKANPLDHIYSKNLYIVDENKE